MWPFRQKRVEYTRSETGRAPSIFDEPPQGQIIDQEDDDAGEIPDKEELGKMTDIQLILWTLADLYEVEWDPDDLSRELRSRAEKEKHA